MITIIALRIKIGSPCLRATSDLKKGLIINGETGGVEQAEEKGDAIEKHINNDELLKRADEVIDTVTIDHRQTRLLPSRDLSKVA